MTEEEVLRLRMLAAQQKPLGQQMPPAENVDTAKLRAQLNSYRAPQMQHTQVSQPVGVIDSLFKMLGLDEDSEWYKIMMPRTSKPLPQYEQNGSK